MHCYIWTVSLLKLIIVPPTAFAFGLNKNWGKNCERSSDGTGPSITGTVTRADALSGTCIIMLHVISAFS